MFSRVSSAGSPKFNTYVDDIFRLRRMPMHTSKASLITAFRLYGHSYICRGWYKADTRSITIRSAFSIRTGAYTLVLQARLGGAVEAGSC